MENVLRILNKELIKEIQAQKIFTDNINSTNIIDQRYGNGNINSCEFRIKELEKTILFLKNVKDIKTEKRLQDLSLGFEDKTFNL